MKHRVTWFDPQPAPAELPRAMPSPFDELGPHPLARRAAETLQAELRAHPPKFEENRDGKMFGVLVVRDEAGRVGFLRAFSGLRPGRWEDEGFSPPLFDREARAAVEEPGEASVKTLLRRREAYETGPGLTGAREAFERARERHADELKAIREAHRERRRLRGLRRRELTDPGALQKLEQESRGDKAERRRIEERQDAERRALQARLRKAERRLAALDRLRRFVCRRLMMLIHDTYRVPNARGELRALRDLFPSAEPPGGAGDCAGPRLLADAFAQGLEPLALAEFWWGPSPPTGGRREGAFYPACRNKCGPLLPFMLEGLEVAPPRRFTPPDSTPLELPVVYEDEQLVVVAKPPGLLSVPGRQASAHDSVLSRLRERHPNATGPLVVHRLDLDTSGLLVAALDSGSHRALQRQFERRQIRKRYVAVLDGHVSGDGGTITLPLRVDLDDRPRQIHDPVHGLEAVTDWRVLAREGDRTRVALFPRTGRTHQLRVHAAHPLGLDAPIVGDRLYGREGARLHLHAEALELCHPSTDQVMRFECPTPF